MHHEPDEQHAGSDEETPSTSKGPDPVPPQLSPDGYGDSDHDDAEAPGLDLPVLPPHQT
jgi:hypothetical protein